MSGGDERQMTAAKPASMTMEAAHRAVVEEFGEVWVSLQPNIAMRVAQLLARAPGAPASPPAPAGWPDMTPMQQYDSCVQEMVFTAYALAEKWKKRAALCKPGQAGALIAKADAIEAAVSKSFAEGHDIREFRGIAELLDMNALDVCESGVADALDDLLAAGMAVVAEVKNEPRLQAVPTAPDYVGTLYRVVPPETGWPAGALLFDISRTPPPPALDFSTARFAVANARSLEDRVSELAEARIHRMPEFTVSDILEQLLDGWSSASVEPADVQRAIAKLVSIGRFRVVPASTPLRPSWDGPEAL